MFSNSQALIPLLLGKEEPVVDFDNIQDDGFTMTLAELAKMNGDEGSPLYVGVMASSTTSQRERRCTVREETTTSMWEKMPRLHSRRDALTINVLEVPYL